MKTTVVIALALMLAGSAAAQTAHIGIYADAGASDCYPRDILPGIFQVYVVLTGVDCSTAAEFSLRSSDGFDGVYLGEAVANEDFIQVGNAETGTAIAFGAYVPSPAHMLTLSYYCNGTSAECSSFEIVANVQNDMLQYVDCGGFLELAATGGKTYVNANESCPCEAPGIILATEVSTWGNIKSIYAQN